MSAIILASGSTDLARRVRLASRDDLLVIRPEQLPAMPGPLMALANGTGPLTTLVIDPPEDQLEEALQLARRFEKQHPEVSVLLVTDRAADMGLTALRSGIRDLVEPDAPIEEIRGVLYRARQVGRALSGGPGSAAASERPPGRVVTIASPKGGVGKTTVATNIAVALAQQAPNSVVLVDLDIQFGDVAAAVDIDPESTLGDVVHGPGLTDALTLKAMLSRHETGLHVLCGVKSPAEADDITARHVGQVLEHLKTEFRYVVIDTAPGLSEHTLVALDHTTDLVLVTSQDVPGVRGLRKELLLLDALELQPSTRHVVLNYSDGFSGLTVRDVEQTIERKVDLALPRYKKVPLSTNQGVPLVLSQPKDRFTKQLVELASRFAPMVAPHSATMSRHRGRKS